MTETNLSDDEKTEKPISEGNTLEVQIYVLILPFWPEKSEMALDFQFGTRFSVMYCPPRTTLVPSVRSLAPATLLSGEGRDGKRGAFHLVLPFLSSPPPPHSTHTHIHVHRRLPIDRLELPRHPPDVFLYNYA